MSTVSYWFLHSHHNTHTTQTGDAVYQISDMLVEFDSKVNSKLNSKIHH